MMRSTRRQLLATAATAAVYGSLVKTNNVASMDHGAEAISAHGIDPMLGVNPSTGTVFLSWVEPAAAAEDDDAAATPASADNDMVMPATGAVMVARSTDGGKTFAEPVVASGQDAGVASYAGSSPQVFAGPEGEIYVAYGLNVVHEGVSWGRDTLRLARSDDDGASFAPAVDVLTDTDALEAGTYRTPLPRRTARSTWRG